MLNRTTAFGSEWALVCTAYNLFLDVFVIFSQVGNQEDNF